MHIIADTKVTTNGGEWTIFSLETFLLRKMRRNREREKKTVTQNSKHWLFKIYVAQIQIEEYEAIHSPTSFIVFHIEFV